MHEEINIQNSTRFHNVEKGLNAWRVLLLHKVKSLILYRAIALQSLNSHIAGNIRTRGSCSQAAIHMRFPRRALCHVHNKTASFVRAIVSIAAVVFIRSGYSYSCGVSLCTLPFVFLPHFSAIYGTRTFE